MGVWSEKVRFGLFIWEWEEGRIGNGSLFAARAPMLKLNTVKGRSPTMHGMRKKQILETSIALLGNIRPLSVTNNDIMVCNLFLMT